MPGRSDRHRANASQEAENLAAIGEVIRETRVVKAVYQGHYHPGYCSEYDGVRYITLPAMCEGEGAFTVADL